MVAKFNQKTRELAVFLDENQFVLRRVTGREEFSRLFEYELEMLPLEEGLDPAQFLGRNVSFVIRDGDDRRRCFNGFIRSFASASDDYRVESFHAVVVPWLWFLTQTSDCRIFQNKTTPEIVEAIFRDLGFEEFEFQLNRKDYVRREYCVQYRETDFNFVSRLLEEEGIYYYFRHEEGKHTLVLADSVTSYFDLELADSDGSKVGGVTSRIADWHHEKQFRSGRWAQTDFNFKTPITDLMSQSATNCNFKNKDAFEVYDFPGRFDARPGGKSLTDLRMEEEETFHEVVAGQSTYRQFAVGGTFTVDRHGTESEVGNAYVVLSLEVSASVSGTYIAGTATDELRFENKFRCIPAAVPFRPQRTTARAIVEGPQTAVVVGPRGEQIYTDEFGRVKVQFHWDREGSRDENSSCWIRVSQTHAGQGWGTIDLPRIGEEVIVSFLEGDPDRPIIKGRVYNAAVMPPFGLPAGKTRSGGKSNTHKGSGYNEVTMDDTAGQEQLRTNAQHNMDTVVGNNQTLTVGVNKSEDIGNNDDLTIAVDASGEVGNDATITVGTNATYEVANKIVIEAGTAITLQCGASTIHMNQAGVISISGQFVSSTATASNSIVAPITAITGSSILNQAGAVALMLGGIAKINGMASAEVTAAGATAVDGGLVVVKGMPIQIGDASAPIVTVPPPGAGDSATVAGEGGVPAGAAAGSPPKAGLGAQTANLSKGEGAGSGNTLKLEEGGTRAMTPGEIELARTVFGDSIDYSKVGIHRDTFIFFQPDDTTMAPNGDIYFPEANYRDDFSQEDLGWQAHFMHEMTHVWQSQNGQWVMIRGIYEREYEYTIDTSKKLTDYNIEQQGDIVRDYFTITNTYGSHNEEAIKKANDLRTIIGDSFNSNVPG